MKRAPKLGRKKSAKTKTTLDFERVLGRVSAGQHYVLRLFITGTTLRSAQAISNIRSLCEEFLVGHYELEVIDIYQQPTAAAGEHIIAAPTLIKKLPEPAKRMIGDLSNRDKVIVGLDLRDPSSPGIPGSGAKWAIA